MTSFVKCIIFPKTARPHPHELFPQISQQLTDNMVPLNIFYSHSESKAFMKIRWPFASRPMVKASSLPQKTVSVSLYVCMYFCVCIKFTQAMPSFTLTLWYSSLSNNTHLPTLHFPHTQLLGSLQALLYLVWGATFLKEQRKLVCPEKDLNEDRKKPGKGHRRNSGRHWGGLPWRRKGSGAMTAVFNMWTATVQKGNYILCLVRLQIAELDSVSGDYRNKFQLQRRKAFSRVQSNLIIIIIRAVQRWPRLLYELEGV